MLDAVERQIRDVDETFDAGLQLDENAEVHQAHDLAGVPRAGSELFPRFRPGIVDQRLCG